MGEQIFSLFLKRTKVGSWLVDALEFRTEDKEE